MFTFRLVSICVLLLAASCPVYADTKVLTADASYIMGDGETPDFAEARALQKAKQTALEEAGTYVQSYTKVQNLDLTTEEIQTIAGGVLQVEVLEKTRSLVADGLRFYTKIKVMVTTDKMEELVRRIKGKNVAEEYAQLQAEYARLSRELENWKQRAGKASQGRERDAAIDHIREGEKAFARIQQSEEEFFQRLVSGKQLVESASRDKEVIDELLNMIVTNGYEVTVGAVQSVLVPANSSRLSLKVPLTIRVSETLQEAVSHAVRALGGSIRSVHAFLALTTPFSLTRGDTFMGDRTMVTLVRLGTDLETTQYFQASVNKLVFTVTFLSGTRELDRCGLSAVRMRTQKGWVGWSPLKLIVPVYREHLMGLPSYPGKGYVEIPDVYSLAYPELESFSIRNSEPYVAIAQDEVTFIAQHELPADAVHSLTGVRFLVRLSTDQDKQQYVKSCTVVDK